MKKTVLILVVFLFIFLILNYTGLKNFILSKDNENGTTIDEKKSEEQFSPLSGLHADEEKINRRPVAVMFDNHPKARWQSGLSDAEILYEFKVEYPYTRYMGIYLINEPKLLGPIRSSRPYFVTTLLDYDPIYVRAGGSEEAKKRITEFNVADIDGISNASKAFWRYSETGKEGPHNLYTAMETIRETQKEKGYKGIGTFEGFKFNTKATDIEGFEANNVQIKYNKENITKYIYDEDNKVYNRYKDGELHIDEYNGETITATNIIIQQVNSKTIDNEGRLSMDLIGEGNGIYITRGKGNFITWKKKSTSEKTYFYNESGEEITLNPGVTWIQITDIKPDLDIN